MPTIAVNPETGERMVLVGGRWQPVSQTAVNPETGEKMGLVGNQWVDVMTREERRASADRKVAKQDADTSADIPSLVTGLAMGGPAAVTAAVNVGRRMLDRRASSGEAARDAAKDEGFLDRAGSLAERGYNTFVGGLSRTAGTVTGSEDIKARARRSESVAKAPVAGEMTTDRLEKGGGIRDYLQFGAETLIGSAPEIAITAIPNVGLPTTALSYGGRIAQERAENDGRYEASGTDLAVGTAVGIGVAGLEKFGVDAVLGKAAQKYGGRILNSSLGRVATGAAGEAATEALQNPLEYAGGTVGTEAGFDPAEAAKQAKYGAIGGGMAGGTLAAGVEAGRQVYSLTNKPKPRGEIESSVALTPDDEASPLPNDLLAEGLKDVRGGEAKSKADAILAQAGMPVTGEKVAIVRNGEAVIGTVKDAFTGEDGATGVQIALPDGAVFKEYIDDIRDDPETDVRPLTADEITAQMAREADEAVARTREKLATMEPPDVVLPDEGRGSPIQPVAPSGSVDQNIAAFKNATRRAESGGNDRAKNPRSSAAGRYQFTDGTWLATYRAEFGDTGESNAQILGKKFNADLQERLMDRLTRDNARGLQQDGIAVTPTSLYVAHFAGVAGARKLYKADPGTPVEAVLGQNVVNANPFLKGMSASEAIADLGRRVGQKGDQAVTTEAVAAQDTTNPWDEALERFRESTQEQAGAEALLQSPELQATDDTPIVAPEAAAPSSSPLAAQADSGGSPQVAGGVPVETSPALSDGEAQPTPDIRTNKLSVIVGGIDADMVSRINTALPDGVSLKARQDGTYSAPVRHESAVRAALGVIAPADAESAVAAPVEQQRPLATPKSGGAATDMLKFVARNGGVSYDGLDERTRNSVGGSRGHDLKNTGALNRFVPGAGPLLRPNGKSLDEVGEALWDAGYFGPPDVTPRPSEDDVLQALDRASRGEKIYSSFDQAPEPPKTPRNEDEDVSFDPDARKTMAIWEAWDQAARDLGGYTFMPSEIARIRASGNERGVPEIAEDETDADAIREYVIAVANREIEDVRQDFYELIKDDLYADIEEQFRRAVSESGEGTDAPESARDGTGEPGPAGDAGNAGPGTQRSADGPDRAQDDGGLDPEAGSLGLAGREAADPALAERQRTETQLRAESPLRGSNRTGQEQDGKTGLGLFDANDQPQMDLSPPKTKLRALVDSKKPSEAERPSGEGRAVAANGEVAVVSDETLRSLPGLPGYVRSLNTSIRTRKNQIGEPFTDEQVAALEDIRARANAIIAERNQEPGPQETATPAPKKAARSKPGQETIEDFGEKLEGARKDTWQAYAQRLTDAKQEDVQSVPLSKSWPEPDYQKLIDDGADPYVVASMRAMRDAIPTKPRSYGVVAWGKQVEALRAYAEGLLNGNVDAEAHRKRLEGEFARSLRDLQGSIDLYLEFGHDRSFKGITFGSNFYGLYRGEQNVTKWAIEQKAKATAFSNWPRELAVADTRDEVLAKFRELLANGGLDKKKSDIVRFDIYSRRGQPGFWVGKKIGKDYADLKRFDTAKEARDYKISDEGYAELVRLLESYKDIPPERKETNSPRIGINHRNGADVTPEQFSEAFGFRGVQFGNYVEGSRRQEDLNEAYDALMDLAGVLNVPAKALSLNGTLGLAFGARGKGGKGAASAHYERGEVVINLTKRSGAGSLAHEWWHSLDNYFSRSRNDPLSYMSNKPWERGEGVRPEMVQAFANVMAAIKSTGLKERSKNLDKRKTKEYWSTEVEMSARVFENYVIAKLADEQHSNDYLANIVSEDAFSLEEGYPYLKAGEIPAVRAAFDEFFRTVETEQTDKGVRLYSIADGDLFDDPVQPERTMTQAQRSELEARKMQGMARRGGQKPIADQEGGLFSAERDQGSLFSRAGEATRQTGLSEQAGKPFAALRGKDAVERMKVHPDYKAAKGGDMTAAARLVNDLVPSGMLASIAKNHRGAIFAPVVADEASGRNAIPVALAAHLSNAASGTLELRLAQNNHAFHTGAGPMERLIERASFDGPVEIGAQYVIVDDVTVMGGTLADMAGFIQASGGTVVGTALLADASRSGYIGPKPLMARMIERRFGDVVRDELGIEPASLTAEEAQYLSGFRDADALRTRIAKGVGERSGRLGAKGIGKTRQVIPDEAAQAVDFNALQSRLESYGIARKVALRVVDGLQNGAAGSYFDRLIEIATNTPQDAAFTLDHEVIHALRDLGMISNADWAILSARARRETALMRSIRGRYEGPLRKAGYKGEALQEALIEEAVADLFAKHQRGDYAAKGTIERLFQRIRQMLEAVRNAFAGRGMRSGAGVMGDIAGGRMGEREARDAKVLAKYSRPGNDAGMTESEDFKRWFAGSKVVSEDDGSPLIVHHMTWADFDEFDFSKLGENTRANATDPEGAVAETAQMGAWFSARDLTDAMASTVRKDAYLRIEQPKRYWSLDELIRDIEEAGTAATLREQLIADGYDGLAVVDEEFEAMSYVAFAGEQIRFIPPGAKYSRPEALPDMGHNFDNPQATVSPQARSMLATLPSGSLEKVQKATDDWRLYVQDEMLPVRRLQELAARVLGRNIADSENPYLQEEMMTGKAGARLQRLAEDRIDPLFQAMHKEKVSIDELETYLYARHAQERNAQIAKINPEFKPGEGSGMTDTQARAILARVERDGKTGTMKALASYVDKMLKEAVETRVEAGLLSREEADAWAQTYKHYVPLRGKKEVDGDASSTIDRINTMSGKSVRGKESKRAFGRRSEADNILAYAILQSEEAIIRAEKNRVARALLKLVRAMPDTGIWRINKVERKRRLNPTTGLVETYTDSHLSEGEQKMTVTAKEDGIEYRITFNRDNEMARLAAESMRNLENPHFNKAMEYLSWFSRGFSAINTRYNPTFVIRNAFRDIQTMAVIGQTFDIEGFAGKVIRDYKNAMFADTRIGKAITSDAKAKEWARWKEEWESAGGKIYYNEKGDIAQIRKGLELRAKRLHSPNVAAQAWVKFFDGIEAMNESVERAIRLATYKNAREMGYSKLKAASMSRNVTVNFTRKGRWSPAINILYPFFNASTQGSFNTIRALVKSKAARKAAGGFIIAGFLSDVLNSLLSGDDDDGESHWDKMADWEKSTNAVLMLPGGDAGNAIKLPLGFGLNALFGVGRNMSAMMRGALSLEEAASQSALEFANAFNPLGNGGSWENIIAPFFLDPFLDIDNNKDFTGKPIQPPQNPFAPDATPSQNYYDGVAGWAKQIASLLNAGTGGDEVIPGAISISPESIEYLGGYVTGGAGRFAMDIANLLTAPFDPEADITTRDIPLVSSVYRTKSVSADKNLFFERKSEVEAAVEYAKEYTKRGDREGFDAFVEDNRAVLEMRQTTKEAAKVMSEIRKERNEASFQYELGNIDKAQYAAVIDRAREIEGKVVTAYNRRWNELVEAKPLVEVE